MDGIASAGSDARTGAPAPRSDHVYAALDLGTTNCRLLIVRPRGPEGFRVIDAFSRIVRLGEGLSARDRLADGAMDRALEALRICAAKMRRRAVTRSRAVATEACRRAANCAGFIARVRAETGLEIEIISPAEEARLAFSGCVPLLDRSRPFALVFDIGGGSTEIGWMGLRRGRPPELLSWISVPVGVVSLTERYGGHRVDPAAYRAMVADATAHLRTFDAGGEIAAALAAGGAQVLGTSGTVTTLAGVHLGLARYDRTRVDGCFLTAEALKGVTRRLAAASYEERVANPCIGRERADVVVAGCAILEAICGLWPVGRLRVADRGVREGILFGLMAADPAAGLRATPNRA
ncbi:MAG: Ppx/GppA family phosphatase, partial [Rhodospirillaceae bacterium]|nr:Ppx/GppA family phosphatase [Rhodospirillaceae bacterium]